MCTILDKIRYYIPSGGDHGGLDEPGQAETDENVEDVASNGVGDRHVTVTWNEEPDVKAGLLFYQAQSCEA